VTRPDADAPFAAGNCDKEITLPRLRGGMQNISNKANRVVAVVRDEIDEL
jgi:hypothetical protein